MLTTDQAIERAMATDPVIAQARKEEDQAWTDLQNTDDHDHKKCDKLGNLYHVKQTERIALEDQFIMTIKLVNVTEEGDPR